MSVTQIEIPDIAIPMTTIPRQFLNLIFSATSVVTLSAQVNTATSPQPSTTAIPFSEIGAKVTADYQQRKGEAIGIRATAEGAQLHTAFQKLSGAVTHEGLWLDSTSDKAGRLRLTASAISRESADSQRSTRTTQFSRTGTVAVTGQLVTFTRPGLTEEYSVSADGVRQDFIVAQRPAGAGALRVDLALCGAQAEAADYGAKLTLAGSQRALAYSRLRVTDALGRELSASLLVPAADHLTVRVEDADAAYPIRIDPTFSDADWVSLNPGIPGTRGSVDATVVDDRGNLYIAGSFTFVGTVAVPGIRVAKWDGSAWTTLGSVGAGNVNSLAVNGTDLYAGGNFITAGGIAASKIAKWNGTTWSALGSGMGGQISQVNALAVMGADLYAGGIFTTAGGVSVNNIAKWNGSVWSSLGSGVNSNVVALAVSGTDLYAGGGFTTAGGVAAKWVAKWNGNAWSALGSGPNNYVAALAVSGTDLYAGGDFTTAGGVTANHIAKWDGSAWSALGSGMERSVSALAASGTELYAGGSFTTAGGVSANGIAKWNGNVWSALGTGMDSSGMNSGVGNLAVSGTDLYAGGYITTVSGVIASGIAKWDGNAWSALGPPGMNSDVAAVAVSGTDIYVGGYFTTTGGVLANHIAKWDGTTWSALGSGLNNVVSALAVSGTDLYAGGHFNMAGGVSANRIAKWDGTTWSALGSGMTDAVFSLAVSGRNLYAGGFFTNAGGISASHIAKWDGNTWSALGSGMNRNVFGLTVSGANLYAGGTFTTAGGVSANRIAKWDGGAWSALGSGLNDHVSALAMCGTDLYAGGYFTTAGGLAANKIAKWNGSAWSALGSGMDGPVHALAVNGMDIYAGGEFTMTGELPTNRIAKWNGSTWSALSSGADGFVSALATDGSGHLYLGGNFAFVGTSTLSPFIAQANLVATIVPSANAGTDYSVSERQMTALDGTASTPNDGSLAYAWVQVPGGTAVTLTGTHTATPSFTAPLVASGGETLSFELTVSFGGMSSVDTVSVTVVNVNHAPVADAGIDQSIAEGSPVTLHGENSFDIDNDIISFAWVQVSGPPVALTGANSSAPTFTAPYAGTNGGAGVVATLVYELLVDDGYPTAPTDMPAPGYYFANVRDRVTVMITNTNNLPIANAGMDQTVDENTTVVLEGSTSTDPDSDTLTYSWVQVGGTTVTLTGATTATPAFTAPFVSAGGADFTFNLTVDDGYGGTATDTVVIHVQNMNDPPLATAAQPTLAILWPPNHQMVSVGITGVSDPDNNATITITGVTQDEPTNGLGDGDTAIDAVIGGGTVLLRSERSGESDGRVYRVYFTASDLEGSTSGVVKVSVPQSVKRIAIDGGQVFDSTN
jgi:PKD domain